MADSSEEDVPLPTTAVSGTRKTSPLFVSSGSSSESGSTPRVRHDGQLAKRRKIAYVLVPPFRGRRTEYKRYREELEVQKVLGEAEDEEDLFYNVRFGLGNVEKVSFERLLALKNGPAALARFNENPQSDSIESDELMVETRARPRKSTRMQGFVDPVDFVDSDDDDEVPSRASRSGRQTRQRFRSSRNVGVDSSEQSLDESDSDSSKRRSRRTRKRNGGPRVTTRSSGVTGSRNLRSKYTVDKERLSISSEASSNENIDILQSDVLPPKRKRKRHAQHADDDLDSDGVNYEKIRRTGTRKSHRSTQHKDSMVERAEDDIERSGSEPERPAAPKFAGAREKFPPLPQSDPFKLRHIPQCDSCNIGDHLGPLIPCQGCTLAYHKGCIGTRASREHLVTKIGDDNFVLQCRRCMNVARKKDKTAPNLAVCQASGEPGLACIPFRDRKTPMQEQKEREDNGGVDPIAPVDPDLINNVKNVLFRCIQCSRGFHFHHLPTRSARHMDIAGRDNAEVAEERFNEYSRDWKCKDCAEVKDKVAGLIAWRPVDLDNWNSGIGYEDVFEDEKHYLIKWDGRSYFRATWMPGAWVWGVTSHGMRKAFAKKQTGPKMSIGDAIPEEYLRIDIVLNIRFTSIVNYRSKVIDEARIKEVDEALIKYKGLPYEEAVWEKVPVPEDGERWIDFTTAYTDWVLGRYTHLPKTTTLKNRLEKARATPFLKLEKKEQPESMTNDIKMMKYQIDGLNWLYHQWHQQKNGILADEMGLGKTIQVIGFLATLVDTWNCFPFLVVVPNSTCPNWRREIKRWAPSLRVVTYFGSAKSREMARRYEMFPEESKELRCHIVVTSYEAAADTDPATRKIFKSVPWAGLVVDEGQRLKSDKSQLYSALLSLKIPFRLLLTGTPLQNNARELFNLLQFLDDTKDAESLEKEYEDMTSEKIKQLHDLIRPYILRRTKAQVLDFLPPMAQIILPVSMSLLQKKVYKSVFERNVAMVQSLFSQRGLKATEKGNLNNILMQLRKCLCHPFVYNQEIEERNVDFNVSHQNLVHASSKLQLLELLLPKLMERGHRVLIFSQFLDMLDILEDFLDGMGMKHQRLDGSVSSLEKQKRIDQFNAPESDLFAFLLSTRAGGVGINLATADTVIVMDPDFNPHQDIQAISRAHRIGQNKKVLCFQLMTRASAEEKIMQIGRKKMALDHVVVEQLDAEDLEDRDLESVLRHGAAELFNDESNADQDIKYDIASVEKLLDRSQIENTKQSEDKSAESQFSFARVWANDQGALEENMHVPDDEPPPDPGMWDKILREREQRAAAEAAAREQTFGRGRRTKLAVDYQLDADGQEGIEPSPVKPKQRRRKGGDSDTDFQADDSDEETAGEEEMPADGADDLLSPGHKKTAKTSKYEPFVRSTVPAPRMPAPPPTDLPPNHPRYPKVQVQECPACRDYHAKGSCPLKLAGIERCNLCGLAHYGIARVCPHFGSETQVREMIETLKHSTEPHYLVDAALKYLRGLKGHIVQRKRVEREKRMAAAQGLTAPAVLPSSNGNSTLRTTNGANGVSASNGLPPVGNFAPPRPAAPPVEPPSVEERLAATLAQNGSNA